ncbi:hypothetical protein EYF80_044773 [Liparis tanakae]|uniref:Uncharacterized protein n=1 Tax=Liparis tanakae TaxID=230148 RepID=A0A4Z2FUZ2_9TELE|nr:hypothetical protein EYF80_044773 [Liparis tanakae]
MTQHPGVSPLWSPEQLTVTAGPTLMSRWTIWFSWRYRSPSRICRRTPLGAQQRRQASWREEEKECPTPTMKRGDDHAVRETAATQSVSPSPSPSSSTAFPVPSDIISFTMEQNLWRPRHRATSSLPVLRSRLVVPCVASTMMSIQKLSLSRCGECSTDCFLNLRISCRFCTTERRYLEEEKA